MIHLPDRRERFEYENNFYLTCDASRIGKLLAHFDLYKIASRRRGDVVECGVFKGSSLLRFAAFRDLMGQSAEKKVIGFDTFGAFPETAFDADRPQREQFISDAGAESISSAQLKKIFRQKKIKNAELVAGDITKTVPRYVRAHPNLKISFLNLDTDIYEPAVTILEHLYPRIVKGGVLILDDYGIFPGETKAVREYFRGRRVTIHRSRFGKTPSYVIKR